MCLQVCTQLTKYFLLLLLLFLPTPSPTINISSYLDYYKSSLDSQWHQVVSLTLSNHREKASPTYQLNIVPKTWPLENLEFPGHKIDFFFFKVFSSPPSPKNDLDLVITGKRQTNKQKQKKETKKNKNKTKSGWYAGKKRTSRWDSPARLAWQL